MELKKIFGPIVLVLFCSALYSQERDVTIKEYVDMQAQLNRELMLKLIEVNNDNINDNVIRANTAMDKRLDGMNEFRDTLKDQSATFITRAELFAWIIALAGLFLGFSRYMKDKQDNSTSKGKSIMSGDTVEVKK